MSHEVFKKSKFDLSEYPADFIPREGKAFLAFDNASADADCTVRGFYKNGVIHVQSVDYNPPKSQ